MKTIFSVIFLMLLCSCVTVKRELFTLDPSSAQTIHFTPGTLEPASQDELAAVADWVVADDKHFAIEGCFCEEDLKAGFDEAYWEKTAGKRARLIKKRLLEAGAPDDMIVAVTFGKCESLCGVRIIKSTTQYKDPLTFDVATTPDNIYFKPGTLDIESEAPVEKLAGFLRANSRRILLEGCYCKEDLKQSSENEFLLAICERRASLIKNKLLEVGIDNKRISTISYGESNEPERCKVHILVSRK